MPCTHTGIRRRAMAKRKVSGTKGATSVCTFRIFLVSARGTLCASCTQGCAEVLLGCANSM